VINKNISTLSEAFKKTNRLKNGLKEANTAVVINKNISPQSPLLHNIDTDMIGSSWLRRKITKF